jgi:hypothetical protein
MSKRYTFDEWVMYLNLLGQEDSGASSDRGVPRMKGAGEESSVAPMVITGAFKKSDVNRRICS